MSQTLVITSCCKKKLDYPAPARELYQGQLFKIVCEYAEKNNYDLIILSAKYGLIALNDVIEPYDQQLKSVKDAKIMAERIYDSLAVILSSYKKIIVIMGKYYRRAIEDMLKFWANVTPEASYEIITDKRGIGGLKQRVKQLIESS
jgi:hypothetical protein